MNDRQHHFQTLDEIGEFFEKCPGLTFIFTARGSEGMATIAETTSINTKPGGQRQTNVQTAKTELSVKQTTCELAPVTQLVLAGGAIDASTDVACGGFARYVFFGGECCRSEGAPQGAQLLQATMEKCMFQSDSFQSERRFKCQPILSLRS